jgi:hypothetical protein
MIPFKYILIKKHLKRLIIESQNHLATTLNVGKKLINWYGKYSNFY